jgi:general secretion pathway protein D
MVFLRPTIVLEKQKAVELTNEKFEGIWEFDISGDLSEESVDVRMNRLFQGVRN